MQRGSSISWMTLVVGSRPYWVTYRCLRAIWVLLLMQLYRNSRLVAVVDVVARIPLIGTIKQR